MSTGTAVVNWQDEMAKEAQTAAAQERPDNNWISFKSGILSLNGNVAKDNRVQVIIFDSAYENALYTKPYDPKVIVSPDCWAIGRDEAEMAPTNAVPNPVSPACPSCPNNQWNSDPSGGKGKACKNVRRIAMIQASDLDKGVAAEILFARIPTMSIKNWATYVTQIANVVRRPSWGVVTELSLVPDTKSQFQVKFSYVDSIHEDHLGLIKAIKEACGDGLLAEYTANTEVEHGSPVPVKGKGGKF